MAAGHWTRITYVPSNSSICLGYLPADTNGSRQSNAQDILHLINCLNGVATCTAYQGDPDRSGASNAQDILGEINLLNGASEFDEWNGASLPPSPCGGGSG